MPQEAAEPSPSTGSFEHLVDADVVGQMLGMGRSWVYEMAWRGDLPCYKLGRAVRFKPADVIQFMESRRCGQ